MNIFVRFHCSFRLRHACIAALLAAVAFAHTTRAEASTLQIEPGTAAQDVTAAINQIRTDAGLHSLTPHPLLIQAAQAHVLDMLAHNHYGHSGTDGSDVSQRVRRTGYGLYGNASENWVSVNDAGSAIRWWMSSGIHRHNILNAKWQDVGVGAGLASNGHIIFVAVFATSGAGASTPEVPSAAPAPAAPAAPPQPSLPPGSPYVVQPGDTLLAIAQRHGLSWDAVASVNGLSEHAVLQVEQVIHLPGIAPNEIIHPSASAPSPVNTDLQVDEPSPAQPVMAAGEALDNYTVQPGDTLISIANQLGITWDELAGLNGLGEESIIQAGQTLRIPGNAAAPVAPAPAVMTVAAVLSDSYQAPPLYHVVQPGDTLVSIAARYGTHWEALLATNGLTENDVLQIGQQLQLPAAPQQQ